ncbi:hypothetical protein AcdelDRAFT_1239 [Acidovorax delafieldii 2AN]|uniref:Uncharacterized protein n=1 Tax=Acidovorax delafieldii 2AN TaxID=573060 RepID=C5T2V9_ACIDE|nr:hypothetical protein [Acidovorax delafieldii]EER61170.1 hypothetical protein AcdelDRAFT_1239 [Acidovorax delafieldii 2AN]
MPGSELKSALIWARIVLLQGSEMAVYEVKRDRMLLCLSAIVRIVKLK